MLKFTRVLAVVIILMVVVAGCGGGRYAVQKNEPEWVLKGSGAFEAY